MQISRIKDVEMSVVGMSGLWRQKKMLACKIEILTIWKSNLFMKMILEMPSVYRRGESKSSIFRNKNNNQIYETLMQAKEETSTQADFIMQFVIATYHTLARVVGFMNPGKKTMYINTKYFDSFSRKKIGSNGSHEFAHTLGGRHSGPNLRLSLMYYLNDVYETCYEHFFEKNLPDIEYLTGEYDDEPVEVPAIPTPKPREYRVEYKRNWWSFWKVTKYKVYDV